MLSAEAKVREASAGLALVAAKALPLLRLDPRAAQIHTQLDEAVRELVQALAGASTSRSVNETGASRG